MYRDEEEALRARVRTLEAELDLADKRRQAAEAEAEAARAVADEANNRASVITDGPRSIPSEAARRRKFAIVVLVWMIAIGVMSAVLSAYYSHSRSIAASKLYMEQVRIKEAAKEVKALRKMLAEQQNMNERLMLQVRQQGMPKAKSAGGESSLPGGIKSDQTVKELLAAARKFYVAGSYAHARTIAKLALDQEPGSSQALQIMGASSCYLVDKIAAMKAYSRLGATQRRLLATVCQRKGVVLMPPEAEEADSPPETLSRAQIQQGMRGVKDEVQSCFDEHKVPGLASVQLSIGRHGVVTSATTKGVFANTPTGTCAAKAVMDATFPAFTGEPIKVTYPFILR